MSNDGNGQTFPKMNSSLKESLLDRMRNTHQSSERNRMARSERELPPAPRRQQARFEDLPEYKQVLTQKIASEQLGIANPFLPAASDCSRCDDDDRWPQADQLRLL